MEIFACFSCISAKNLVSLQHNKTGLKHGFYSQKGWHFRLVTMALRILSMALRNVTMALRILSVAFRNVTMALRILSMALRNVTMALLSRKYMTFMP